MSLDIDFRKRINITCPKCGEIVHHYDCDTAESGGRVWYSFLEWIGYYVPYDKRTEENDWYGKDMVLTNEQVKYLYKFIQEETPYNENEVLVLVATALAEGNDIVVNADW